MVQYIRSDLEFILEQIKIAEAHAAGQPLYGPGGLIPTYNLAWGLRTVDGTYNHLLPGQEKWGAAGNQFPELVDATFDPAQNIPPPFGPPGPPIPTSYNPSNNPGSMVFDSMPRTISNLLVDQTLGNPAAILTALERAGADSPMLDLPAVTAIYAAFKPSSDAEYQARVVMQAAVADFNDDPLNPTMIAARDAAVAAHDLTVADLVAARVVRDAALEPFGIEMQGDNVYLPNIAPDEGLSAPFNSWFTLFGQFFDHGLDLVNKGGSGTVFIPLQPDDPLYVEGSQTNFMVLTRATVAPGQDGVFGTADDIRPVNTTTSFVDQNQTYTSHSSHQVFLRQYVLDADGDPVATGKLIEGANGGMATWGEVKAQAADMLGIQLTDSDVGKCPAASHRPLRQLHSRRQRLPAVDHRRWRRRHSEHGRRHRPRRVHPAAPIGHDRRHPHRQRLPGRHRPRRRAGRQDRRRRHRHRSGQSRQWRHGIRQRAARRALHRRRRSRQREHRPDRGPPRVPLRAQPAGRAHQGCRAGDATTSPSSTNGSAPTRGSGGHRYAGRTRCPAGRTSRVWDGERLFQAAKFGTEMQYQHLVFEEFARKIQPNINVFLVPDGYDVTIDPSIVAEFAHVVYRFGHSMLTETIDRFDPTFTDDQIGLIEGFLNPLAVRRQPVPHRRRRHRAGAIIRGMTRQVGNEIDEFVTSALRNNLLGLPLDLATINLARGRDTGVPSLNEARRDFYEATNQDVLLKPYESWVDFAGHLKNEASIINFIAAYGTHSLITSADTIEGKRDAALTIITGQAFGDIVVDGSVDLRTATGWTSSTPRAPMPAADARRPRERRSLDRRPCRRDHAVRRHARLDLQLRLRSADGEAAERRPLLLPAAARRPAPVRRDGEQLLRRDDHAQHRRDASAVGRVLDPRPHPRGRRPSSTIRLGEPTDLDGDSAPVDEAPTISARPDGGGILTPLVLRNNPATAGPDTNYLRYTGDEHVVLGGTDGNDILIASIGDDTLFGDGGNDRLEGGFGNDIINGGDGDDIIATPAATTTSRPATATTSSTPAPASTWCMGDDGQDFIFLGTDMGSEVFAGDGNDFIFGNKNAERILGNEGDDWIETGTFDGAPGDNFDEIFAHDGDRRKRRVPRRRRLRRVHRRRRRRHHGRQPGPRQDGRHVRLRLGDLQGQRRSA